MTKYELVRIVLAGLQVIATLFAPFVLIFVNNRLNKKDK